MGRGVVVLFNLHIYAFLAHLVHKLLRNPQTGRLSLARGRREVLSGTRLIYGGGGSTLGRVLALHVHRLASNLGHTVEFIYLIITFAAVAN